MIYLDVYHIYLLQSWPATPQTGDPVNILWPGPKAEMVRQIMSLGAVSPPSRLMPEVELHVLGHGKWDYSIFIR